MTLVHTQMHGNMELRYQRYNPMFQYEREAPVYRHEIQPRSTLSDWEPGEQLVDYAPQHREWEWERPRPSTASSQVSHRSIHTDTRLATSVFFPSPEGLGEEPARKPMRSRTIRRNTRPTSSPAGRLSRSPKHPNASGVSSFDFSEPAADTSMHMHELNDARGPEVSYPISAPCYGY